MPTGRKGARLWLRPGRRGRDGSIRQATWIILDGGRHIATGCVDGEAEGAERKLAAYIASKYAPRRKERSIEAIDVADVLSIYLDDRSPPDPKGQRELIQHVGRLNSFWSGRMLADVSGTTCRAYTAERVAASARKGGSRKGGARRDLEVLRAAINHHAEQGFHREAVKVALPDKGAARDRWLTRSEAAHLLWICWCARETQTAHGGNAKGSPLVTKRRPLRHLARFILIGLYTGTRAAAIASASPDKGEGRSFVDLDAGKFYRLAEGKQATNKRQPVVTIPGRLLAHMRRWARIDAEKAKVSDRTTPVHFVEWGGRPLTSVKTGFARAVDLAKLGDGVSPHTLRHTAATWLMQAGVNAWEAANFLGMSVQMIDRTYGHHHPDHQKNAANRLGYRHTGNASALVVRLVDAKTRRANVG